MRYRLLLCSSGYLSEPVRPEQSGRPMAFSVDSRDAMECARTKLYTQVGYEVIFQRSYVLYMHVKGLFFLPSLDFYYSFVFLFILVSFRFSPFLLFCNLFPHIQCIIFLIFLFCSFASWFFLFANWCSVLIKLHREPHNNCRALLYGFQPCNLLGICEHIHVIHVIHQLIMSIIAFSMFIPRNQSPLAY